MIEEVKAYKVGDLVFITKDEARREMLLNLFSNMQFSDSLDKAETVADFIMHNKDQIIAILTGKEMPKPRKPRKDKGTKRERKQEQISA